MIEVIHQTGFTNHKLAHGGRQGMHSHSCHVHTSTRSHFVDFMLEIGEDPHVVHLCCVPTENVARPHSKSRPITTKSSGKQRANITSIFPSAQNVISYQKRERESRAYPCRNPGGISNLSNPPYPAIPAPSRLVLPSSTTSKPTNKLRLKIEPTFAIDYDTECDSPTFSSVPTTARKTLLTFVGHTTTIEQGVRATADAADPDYPSPPRQKLPSRQMSVSSNQGPSTSSAASSSTLSRSPSASSLATTSSSEGPATPRATSPILYERSDEPNHILSDLERYSRFQVQAKCVVCERPGTNFPSCAKCGDMWCSRQCRMLSGGEGGKHLCQSRPGVPAVVIQQL